MSNTELSKENNDAFKAGVMYALDEATKWMREEVRNYVAWNGEEIELDALIEDFKKEMAKRIVL